jgi:hypothetical protein
VDHHRRLLGGGWAGFRWSPVRIEVLPAQTPQGSDRVAAADLRERVRAAILARCGDPDAAPAATAEAA